MLFQLKEKDQKSKSGKDNISNIEKLKSIFLKAKFVAKNVVYIRNWSKSKKDRYLKNEITKQTCRLRNSDIVVGSFLIKIINEPHPLMSKVKKLRQKSFFANSKENEFDSDEFDKNCDHLVVIDKSVSESFVVGTYRLLLKPKFAKKQIFYSQSEFNISNLVNKKSSTILEAGRSCVEENYRDGRIIKLLWRGLATYIFNNQVDLIFGCASFPSSNYNLFRNQLSYLYHYHSPPESIITSPIENVRANFKISDKNFLNKEEEFRNLPPLIKAYLRVGAWVGQGAVIDKIYNTTDVLNILKAKKIMKKYRQLSFQKVY